MPKRSCRLAPGQPPKRRRQFPDPRLGRLLAQYVSLQVRIDSSARPGTPDQISFSLQLLKYGDHGSARNAILSCEVSGSRQAHSMRQAAVQNRAPQFFIEPAGQRRMRWPFIEGEYERTDSVWH